jgi:uncharacterized protein YegL
LLIAEERNKLTNDYFRSLLNGDRGSAVSLYTALYTAFKMSKSSQESIGVHVVFLLDESGSMSGAPFRELCDAYDSFIAQRLSNGSQNDRMSVVMFNDRARNLVTVVPFNKAPSLTQIDGGTSFAPALENAKVILQSNTNLSLTPVLILMTDGGCGDINDATSKIAQIDAAHKQYDLQVHLVAFGAGADMRNLEALANNVSNGTIHLANIGKLVTTFKEIENSIAVAVEHY